MSHRIAKIGDRFGNLRVVSIDHARMREHGRLYWRCACDCGGRTSTIASMLAAGLKRNCRTCGYKKGAVSNTKHGLAKRNMPSPPEYNLWVGAKARARRNDLPFSISPQDIVIPELCPVFGVYLKVGTRENHENSPSVDQIIPGLGYTPENIWVISYRANRIKHNATLVELRALADALERRIACHQE